MEQTLFRIGIIGCGRLASQYHGPAIAQYVTQRPGTQLVACCDVEPTRAREFSTRFGAQHWETDYARMLSQHSPDAVCLFVPAHLTCELSCQIIDRGFPLLLEKPPGLTTLELDRMIRSAENAHTHVDVAFNRRHMPLIRRLMQSLSEDVPSEAVQHIQYELIRWDRRDRDFTVTAIHGIDLVQHVARSRYHSITCHYHPIPELGPTVANFHLFCRFESGATATLNFCPVAGVVAERLSVHSRDQSFYVELPMWGSLDAPGRFRHIRRGHVVADVDGRDLDPHHEEATDLSRARSYGFYDETAAFFEHIRRKQPAEIRLRDARQVVEIAEAIRHRHEEVDCLKGRYDRDAIAVVQ